MTTTTKNRRARRAAEWCVLREERAYIQAALKDADDPLIQLRLANLMRLVQSDGMRQWRFLITMCRLYCE